MSHTHIYINIYIYIYVYDISSLRVNCNYMFLERRGSVRESLNMLRERVVHIWA